MTREQAARILWKARIDPQQFIEQTLWIRAKSKQVMPFVFNEAQKQVYAPLLEQLATGKPVRAIILKARQEGVSTLTEALIFTWLLAYPHARGLVLADTRELAQELLGISRFFYDKLDARLRPEGEAFLNKMQFNVLPCSDGVVPMHTTLTVDTATGKETGRGKTIHFLHLSEFGFYPDPERTLGALLPTVPDAPGTAIIIESTANGLSNPFHTRWQQAERGEGSFVPIFLPWFVLPDYQTEVPNDWHRNAEEEELAGLYSLTDRQLAWRRQVIIDKFAGNGERFTQEFPANAAEAFLSSGFPAFSKTVLMDYRRQAENPVPKPERGRLSPGDPPRFTPDPEGPIVIYTPPREATEYLIGADTALGVENGDASAAAVLDRTRQRVVATWWGHLDPRRYAHQLALLGTYYKSAILAPETNNTGLTTLIELTNHLQYPAVYRWRRYDNLKQIWTDKLGWQTTAWSRPMLIDDMAYALVERLIGIPSLQAIDELLIFDRGPQRVADDDLAIATMIAWHCHLVTPLNDGTMPRTVIEQTPAAPVETLDVMALREWKTVDDVRKRGATQPTELEQVSDVVVELDEMESWVPEVPW
jgi:hypothetical protein